VKFGGSVWAALPLALAIGWWSAPAAADDATIAARQRFFGAENVDATDGQVNKDRVIFSWVTNASLAVSLKGRIVLLDTYIPSSGIAAACGGA
jgi:hypothetical protein